MLTNVKDFVIPVLKVLDSLDGRATLQQIEDAFYKRFAEELDPSKKWLDKTRNHGKELWRDYCGARVAYHYLRPKAYITIERHGNKGSIYMLTTRGKDKAGQ
jgi:hypothetical protein